MSLPDFNRNEEGKKVCKLFTLAAYQGCYNGRLGLVAVFYGRSKFLKRGSADWRKNILLSLYWYGKSAEVPLVEGKDPMVGRLMAMQLDIVMRSLWHPRPRSSLALEPLPGYSHIPFCTWALAKGGQRVADLILVEPSFDNHAWKNVCASCGNEANSQDNGKFKACARCKGFCYCSKKCQVEHWKAGHKVDCKGHWIEEFFPDLRKTHD
jgi:hypothetical protein